MVTTCTLYMFIIHVQHMYVYVRTPYNEGRSWNFAGWFKHYCLTYILIMYIYMMDMMYIHVHVRKCTFVSLAISW